MTPHQQAEIARNIGTVIDIALASVANLTAYLVSESDPMDDARIAQLIPAITVPLLVLQEEIKKHPQLAMVLAMPFAQALQATERNPFQKVIDGIREDARKEKANGSENV